MERRGLCYLVRVSLVALLGEECLGYLRQHCGEKRGYDIKLGYPWQHCW